MSGTESVGHRFKVGMVYFVASIDGETQKIEIDEYVLRTIRGQHGHLTMRTSFAWGKRSSRHGDFGWLEHIPSWCRWKFRLDKGPPGRFARSRTQSLRHALSEEKQNIAEGFGSENADKIVMALTQRIKREMARKRRRGSATGPATLPS